MAEDHEARRMASEALSKIKSHEDFCVERARRAELFETQTAASFSNIQEKMDKSIGRIHDKLEGCVTDIRKSIADQKAESARSRLFQTIILSIAPPVIAGVLVWVMTNG